jgi:ankyrin repeat protein
MSNALTIVNRRKFIAKTLASATAINVGAAAENSSSQTNSPDKPGQGEVVRKRGPQSLEMVYAFVGAGHGNLEKVKELLAADPHLIFASRDWGGGDWETALGGASHTGHREIALYLLSQGARIDAYCAAMLGERDVMLALLKTNPSVATAQGPHGYTLLYHAAISGDVAIAEALKSLLPPNAKDFNQALSAAARGGHPDITKWLLENGVTDPNVPDGFNKTALMHAVEKKLPAVEAILRSHGAHEKL